MGTVVAIETDAGVAIAGDKRETRGGTVAGDTADRIVDLDEIGAGVIGDAGNAQEFRRRFEAELKEADLERNLEIDIEVLGRIAARVAEATGVEAAVATHDGEGIARIRRIGSDGSSLSDTSFALGSGEEIALGRLETADRSLDLRSTEALLRDIVEAVAERDPETGEEVDLWSLASEATDN